MLADGSDRAATTSCPPAIPASPTVQRIEAERRRRAPGRSRPTRRRDAGPGRAPPRMRCCATRASTRRRRAHPGRASRVRRRDASTATRSPASPIAASIVAPIVFVALFMVSIFITSGYLLQSVTEEKENRVVEIVLSSVPSAPLMGGKILGLGAAGLTQVAIWVVTGIVALPLARRPLRRHRATSCPSRPCSCWRSSTSSSAISRMARSSRPSGRWRRAIARPSSTRASSGSSPRSRSCSWRVFLTDLSSLPVAALAIFPLTAPTAMLLVLGLAPEIPWHLVGASLVSLVLSVDRS